MTTAVDVASFQISVDHFPVSPRQAGRIRKIQVVEDLEALSTFTLELSCWDPQTNTWLSDEAGSFRIGSLVNISLGNSGDLGSVIEGDVTEHEMQLSSSGSPTLSVHGFSPLHRLERGVHSRAWDTVSESALLAEIAAPHRLQASATDLSAPDRNVSQHRISDLQFLRQRAARLGYALSYADGTIHFHPSSRSQRSAIQLRAGRELIEFRSRRTVRGQVDQAWVRYLNDDSEETRLLVSFTGPDDAGPNVAKRAFGSATMIVPDRVEDEQAEAERVALAALKRVADGYIAASGTTRGDHRLRAGGSIEIPDVGAGFAGRYILTRVTHTLSGGQTYRTSFAARRVS